MAANTQSEQQKEKINLYEENYRDLQDNIKHKIIHMLGVSEEQERERARNRKPI